MIMRNDKLIVEPKSMLNFDAALMENLWVVWKPMSWGEMQNVHFAPAPLSDCAKKATLRSRFFSSLCACVRSYSIVISIFYTEFDVIGHQIYNEYKFCVRLVYRQIGDRKFTIWDGGQSKPQQFYQFNVCHIVQRKMYLMHRCWRYIELS